MNWKTMRPLLWAFLSAFVVLWSGFALGSENTAFVDVVRIGSDVTVTENQVAKDAVAIGGSVTLLEGGQVTGDAVAIGGNVNLAPNARVDQDAVAIFGEVQAESGASIGGNQVAILGGMQTLIQRFGIFGTFYFINIAFYLLTLVFVILCGIFLLLVLPTRVQTIASTINQQPFKSATWGLGSLIAAAIVSVLVAGSLLGFLLIPLIHLAVAIFGLVGCTGLSLLIGQKLWSAQSAARGRSFLLGVLILGVISLIPLVGGLIVLLVNLFGFGAVLLSRFGTVQPEITERGTEQIEGTA